MNDELPELLSVKQASKVLSCHPNTLRLWEKKGLIKSVRFGVRKDRRFPKEEIIKLLGSNQPTGIEKVVLPSNYDLTRIDMTATRYGQVNEEIVKEFKGHTVLQKEVITSFNFKNFIGQYNQGIKYFSDKELSQHKKISEKILFILTSRRYRNGSLETIHLEKHKEYFLKKIEAFIAAGEPIKFMLPAFPFKIANPLKSSRGDADLAEVAAFCRFNEINLQIRKIYKPGAQFYVFHDGHLYYRHFLHTKEDANTYFDSLKRFIKELNLADVVILLDAMEELKRIKDFSQIYEAARTSMTNLWGTEKYSNEKVQRIIESSKANVSLAHVPFNALYRLSFLESWDLSEEEKKLKQEIDERAEKCAFEYMVVQHALEKADFFNTIVPGGIRLTVHPKEGQIGTYLVKRKTYLLPWMGVGVVKNNGEISVRYESELLGNTKYQPVFIKGEQYPFYYHEAEVVYEGVAEFKSLFDSIVASVTKDDYYWAFAFKSEYFNEDAKKILVDVHGKLAKKLVEDKAICRRDIFSTIQKTYQDNKNIKLKSVDYDIPTGVIILKDRVINLLWGDVPAAFEIKTPEVVKRYQEYFQEVWVK
jgi:pyoverdine/dityrosine biosynthesis protein Dit1